VVTAEIMNILLYIM